MGIFDGSKAKHIEFLEEERKKLWNRIVSLEKATSEMKRDIQKKASDSEKDAAHSSRKAAEYKNKAEQRLGEAENILSQINSELESAKRINDSIAENKKEVDAQQVEIGDIKVRLDEAEAEFGEKFETLNSKIEQLDAFIEKYPDLDAQLEHVDEYIASLEENVEKSGISVASINKRKKEIDDLHREIFGYLQTDEDGVNTKVEGLKEELETAYKKLSIAINETKLNVETLKNTYATLYKDFESNHRGNYEAIVQEIRNLLPNALTAGLSAAFSSKKSEEQEAFKKLQSRFAIGIYLLIGVSTIPLVVSIIFLSTGVNLLEAINRLPRLVLAIVPMYIPVLWFTYSANKKLNLSKRLIEEYSHKEVLSKTYEGLSTQISSINDKETSELLKIKLLSNFLQVSSENPGKLISNYEASDHPIMEALEQTYKFQVAFDRLEGIPGIGKVAAILESKAKKKLDEKKSKIDAVLQEELES